VSYRLLILPRAQKQLAAIPSPDFDTIEEQIKTLSENPRPAGCKKLRGREGWRLRVGNFRVVYAIDDSAQSVLVLAVGHRREIYR
jgi:mRNA interferase RelE/StbE